MDILTVSELIRQGESEKQEFKRSVSSPVGRTICAFLNTSGGRLIIGVEDDGRIVGCEKESADQISNMVSAMSPRPKIQMEKAIIEGRLLIVVNVPKSDKLHTFGNVGYVRIGATTREIQLNEIIEKAAESLLLRFDEAICIDATDEDLSVEILRKYLDRRNEVRKVPPPKLKEDKILELLKATSKGKITNAGILFFSDHPERFHPVAQLRFIEFRNDDMKEVVEEKTFSGSIWKISDDAGDFLEKRIAVESIIKGFEKIVAPSFPIAALREALNNALTHRNYFDPADIRIFLFPSRLEIVNPGSFPPDVTPQMPAHRPRNILLSQYFYDIGKIEKYGSGLYKMRSLCIESGYPEPEFALESGQTKVTFPFLPIGIRDAMKGLDDTDRKIVSEIFRRKGIRMSELFPLISLSKPAIISRLNRFVEKKILIRTGKGRSSRYEFA